MKEKKAKRQQRVLSEGLRSVDENNSCRSPLLFQMLGKANSVNIPTYLTLCYSGQQIYNVLKIHVVIIRCIFLPSFSMTETLVGDLQIDAHK